MNGALLINKPEGISSFGVVNELQNFLLNQRQKSNPAAKRRDLPKMGHGGTLDPFATGLLIVLVGRAVKLARYFLGANKSYKGVIRFGETTVPGDPTSPISERSEILPKSLEQLQEFARKMTLQPYLQTPPMHSAKKVDGRPLYELAREGIEVEREPKLCHLYQFDILDYENNRSHFKLLSSSGTYVRTLAQDFAGFLGTVAMLDSLCRTGCGEFRLDQAYTLSQLADEKEDWDDLSCWVPFNRLLSGYRRAEATRQEAEALVQGKQNVLFNILNRIQPNDHEDERNAENYLAIYCDESLVAVARHENGAWGLERVFT